MTTLPALRNTAAAALDPAGSGERALEAYLLTLASRPHT
jgi:hypothetical protein